VPLARLEPHGMTIIIGLLFILPLLGDQLGVDLDVIGNFISRAAAVVTGIVLALTGNA
jgi:hypothetical protein